MLKKITFICCLISLFFACSEENTYKVSVNLSNLEAQTIYAVFESADLKTVDTLAYDGQGVFFITPKQADYRMLTIYYDNFTQWITVYLENPQRIVVSGDALFPDLVQIRGGRINELLSDFRKETASLLKEYSTLSNVNDTVREQLNGTYNITRLVNINHELRTQAEVFIRQNPDEKASAILIRDYFLDPDKPLQIDNLLEMLSPKLDDFYVVQDLKAYTEKAGKTIPGAKAPDFNVRNIYGKSFTRDSLLNSYFLLAFTSMWNDECHTKELQLDKVVSSFPKDSLSVIIVSLDENPQELRNMIRKDTIEWNIVPDSLGQAIHLLDLYNINVVPRCFLIDKEGYIILKTENGAELINMLEQLIPKNKK